MKEINESTLRKIEWFVAISITVFCVALHFLFMQHAGGLWRDEAAAVNVAEMPSLKAAWDHLYFELFPMSWFLVARVWWALGLGSDPGFRALGFLTGLLVLAAMWFTARSFRMRFPLFMLLLAGLNPVIIIFGDSMRAWGLGVFWIVLEFGLIWRVLESPTRVRVVCATLVAIAAVQTTYYNSLLLFALGLAAFIVAARRRQWRTGALILAIGMIAGATMLPYIRFFRWGTSAYSIIRTDYTLDMFIGKVVDSLSGYEAFSRVIIDVRLWALFVLLAIIVGYLVFVRQKLNVSAAQKDLLLFVATTLALAAPAYFFFLHNVGFPTSTWYYIPLIAVAAMVLDTIFSVLDNETNTRWMRLGMVLLFLGFITLPLMGAVKIRLTNIDLLATRLNAFAKKNDLIVVATPYYGISFAREFSGPAPWTCLPPMKHPVHRFDLLKEFILQPDRDAAIQGVLDEAQQTLKAGGFVWVVCDEDIHTDLHHLLPSPLKPRYFPNPNLTRETHVLAYWSGKAGFFLHTHSLRQETVPVPVDGEVSRYEKMYLEKLSGWRD